MTTFEVDGKEYVICDWPQCECNYDCERQDKHDEFVKERDAKQACSHIWATQDAIGRPYCAECGTPWELRK